MSSLRIKGYMDKRGLLRNGMKELVVKFPDDLRLQKDEGRDCGYRMRVGRRAMSRYRLTQEVCKALLFWESEGEGYELMR